MIYDKKYCKTHNMPFCKAQLFRYYSQQTKTPMSRIHEMVMELGDMQTIKILNIKLKDLRLEKLRWD